MPFERMLMLGAVLLAAAAFVFAPTLIALARNHPERRRIGQLNVLALLSFLLWFALLVWAIGGQRDESRIARLIGDENHRGKLKAAVAVLVAVGVATTAYALTHH